MDNATLRRLILTTPKIGKGGMRPANMSAQEILLSRAALAESGCIVWTGGLTLRGYGQTDFAGKKRRVHRLAYETWRGPIAGGLFVLHRCDNPQCFNPDHLFLGNNAENVADMKSKGRQAKGAATNKARLTADDVRAIRAAPEGPTALAAKYGVAEPTIRAVLTRSIWAHVEDEARSSSQSSERET